MAEDLHPITHSNCIRKNKLIDSSKMKLYPLKFEPILKPMIWGGNDLCNFKGIDCEVEGIGESWEISGVEENVSVIANGEMAGKALDALLKEAQSNLVGKKVYEQYGDTFPLLIKFIDAKTDLSIQVHPDDKLAKVRHNSFGKTEMWYVIDAAKDAFLYTGFEKQLDAEKYESTVEDNTFTDYLKKYYVHPGDVFFLPAGRVHAIGGGCFIAEIQQTSNVTYRIYDYDRTDASGNKRELHTELAKDAIDFSVKENYQTDYIEKINEPNEIVSCEYFTTNLLDIDQPLKREYDNFDSFVIYICMQGSCSLTDNKGNEISIRQGESVLIPADTKSVKIVPSEASKLLETYVK